MAELYINYGTNLQQMTYKLMEEAKIADSLKPSMKVGIKPNLVVARPADGGATTHPEIVEGIIRYVLDAGVKDITVLEGSWVGDSTKRAFVNCGYSPFAEKYGVKLHDTKEDKTVPVACQGVPVNICESALKMDYLINVPVLKGHCQTGMTCCIKNLKGCISDSEKRRFHTMGLMKPIAALGTVLKPALQVVDSVCGDLSFEEGGNPVVANRVMLGFDPVLVDSYGAKLLGFAPDEIEYLRLAKNWGAGNYADDKTEIVELNADKRPITKNLSQYGRGAKRLAEYIEEDSACSACYAALVYALDKAGAPRGQKIKIGQGYKGKACGGVGVGNCTAGCDRYVKGCPPKASDIIEMLRGR